MGLLYSVYRETVGHLETHHLLCPWDCFTVSVGRLWDILRPITCCVHGIALQCQQRGSETSWGPSPAVSMGLLYSVCRETVGQIETHHLLCPWYCFPLSQQDKSSKTFYLTNDSEDTCHQFVCVSIWHTVITGVQHILRTGTAVPWLAQTTVLCTSFCCIILQSSLACFNVPKALVRSEGHCATVATSRMAKWLIGKDARNVVVLCP